MGGLGEWVTTGWKFGKARPHADVIGGSLGGR